MAAMSIQTELNDPISGTDESVANRTVSPREAREILKALLVAAPVPGHKPAVLDLESEVNDSPLARPGVSAGEFLQLPLVVVGLDRLARTEDEPRQRVRQRVRLPRSVRVLEHHHDEVVVRVKAGLGEEPRNPTPVPNDSVAFKPVMDEPRAVPELGAIGEPPGSDHLLVGRIR